MKKEKKDISVSQVVSNCLFAVKEVFNFNKGFVVANFLILIVLECLYTIESTYYVKLLIEAIQYHKPFWHIVVLVAVFVGIQFLANCADWFFYGYTCDIVWSRFTQSFNKKIFRKAGNVEIECYENAEFYNKYTQALDATATRVMKVESHALQAVATFVRVASLLAIMIAIDPGVGVFLIFPLVGNFLFGKWLNNLEQKRYQETTIYNRIIDYVMRAMHLQQFAKEMRITDIFPLLQKKHERAVEDKCAVFDKFARKNGIVYWIKCQFTYTLIFEGILTYCSYRALVNGTIDLAEMTILTTTMTSAAWGIIYMFDAIMEIHKEGVYIQNARDFLEYEEKIPEDGEGIAAPEEIDSIEFRNVCFTYRGEEKQTLKNISFIIEKGKTVALVGHNGAGKSTLVKLLLRLYDPDSGEILVNGVNIKEYELGGYRKLFSAAFQDHQVIAMSVLDNMTMGIERDGSEERAVEILRKVGLYDKIEALENGIHTVMTREFDDNGAVLSGGQYQKLAVARALMQSGECMVFDEPSSALDPIAEFDLFSAIVSETQDKMTVIISHRLSSVKSADVIYMLNDGEIAESGDHYSLMDKGGLYAEMYRHQAYSYLAMAGEGGGINE